MSIKNLVFAIVLGLTLLAQGQDKKVERPFDFKCATEMPTTSFWFAEDGDHFNIRIMHHNGTKYAPFSQRMIVPNDMAQLLDNAEVAKITGDDLVIRWNKKNCDQRGAEIFSCVGGGESLTSAKKQIKPWLISRSQSTTHTAHGDFHKTTITFSYEIEGKSHDYLMEYSTDECRFEEEI